MSNFGSHVPYGFSRTHVEPTQMNKFNYKGGVWNKVIPYNDSDGLDIDTGTTAHPGSTVKPNGTNYSGWLYFIPERLPDGVTGKKFQLDFVFFAGTGYYDYTETSSKIQIAFYSETTKQWTGWQHLAGPYWTHYSGGTDSVSSTNFTSTPRPYFGLLNKSAQETYVTFGGSWPTAKEDSESAGVSAGDEIKNYTKYKAYLQSKGVPLSLWDNGMKSYLQASCLGYRYLSNASTSANKGKWTKKHWQNGGSYNDPLPNVRCITGNWQSASKTSNLTLYDGGSSGTLSFYIDSNFIKNVCGTLASISKFKLRFFYGDVYWDWPKDDLPQWQALDNPQVGLLDWTNDPKNYSTNPSAWPGNYGDWPPRYDARAWYRNKSAAIQQPELMVKYNNKGNENNWTIN